MRDIIGSTASGAGIGAGLGGIAGLCVGKSRAGVAAGAGVVGAIGAYTGTRSYFRNKIGRAHV